MALQTRVKYNEIRHISTVAVLTLRRVVISLIFGCFVLSVNASYDPDTLRVVIIFFRHGARSPTGTYNTDPYKDYQWPDGWGSLTKNGKQQLYELGRKYRTYYSGFVPQEYSETDVYVRSSDKSRCMMSAYTFLAGLYPPSERQAWHPEIPWQPIPVHSLPRELDDIVAGTKPCKLYKKMYLELLNNTKTNVDFTSYLSNHTNETVSDCVHLNFLYSTLAAQKQEGFILPDWSNTVFPDSLRASYMTSLSLFSYNETLQRLRVGPLLSQFMEHFEKSIDNKSRARRLYVYSGHDVNVVSLWRSIGFEELLDPEYGASLTFELHSVEGNYFIKVFLRNNTIIEDPLELNLPYCSNPCPYFDFIKQIRKLIPHNWMKECNN